MDLDDIVEQLSEDGPGDDLPLLTERAGRTKGGAYDALKGDGFKVTQAEFDAHKEYRRRFGGVVEKLLKDEFWQKELGNPDRFSPQEAKRVRDALNTMAGSFLDLKLMSVGG